MTTSVMRVCAATVLVLVCGCVGPASAAALEKRAAAPQTGAQAPAPPEQQVSTADIQTMFDAMTMVDAEKFVPLTPEQYPTFVQRLKRLQDARTLLNRKRNRATNELRAMVGQAAGKEVAVDDAVVDAKLKELATVENEGRAAVAKAQDDLDLLLSVRQRARFRLLEENEERKKLDFLTKVRK